MKRWMFVIAMLVSGSSFAADKSDGLSGSIAVENIICDESILANATGGNGAAYQSGVDVNGNPVTPADITVTSVKLPDYIEVPLTIDLAKKMDLLHANVEAKGPVANLKLYRNGKVEYNGQDVSVQADALCGRDSGPVSAAPQTENKTDERKPDEVSSVGSTNSIVAPNIEPAVGEESATNAVSQTVSAIKGERQPLSYPMNAGVPASGSVVASATSFEPRYDVQMDSETVNRSPINMEAANNYVGDSKTESDKK